MTLSISQNQDNQYFIRKPNANEQTYLPPNHLVVVRPGCYRTSIDELQALINGFNAEAILKQRGWI